MPTVNELIHAALPPDALVRAGAAGLGRAVHHVVVASPNASVGAGGVVVVDGQALGGPRAWLEPAGPAALAAVLAVGPVDAAVAQLADECATPLVCLPRDADAAVVARGLTRWLLEQVAQTVRQANQWTAEFQALAELGMGVPLLVERAVRLSGKPMQARISGFAEELRSVPTTSTLPSELLAAGFASASAGGGARLPRQAPDEAPVRYVEVPWHGLACLTTALPGGAHAGELALVARAAELTDRDRGILVAAATAVAGAWSETSVGGTVGALLASVAGAGACGGPDAARPQHVGLAVDARGEVAPADLAAALGELAPPELVAVRPRGGFALLPLARKQAEADARARVAAWHADLAAQGLAVSVGLSEMHRDATGQRLALAEAGEALLAGERVLGSGHVAAFNEMYLLRFLREACDLPQVREFHATVLGPLMAYDRAERGETLATLEAFFAAAGSVQGTADRLGMHRNSIIYRLKRISEITQLNLDDGDTRLRLHLALRLERVLRLAAPGGATEATRPALAAQHTHAA